MDAEDFNALRKQAAALHASQPANDKAKVSLDAVFMALAAGGGAKPKAAERVRRMTDETPPDWFEDTLKRLKGTGERITVGRFLLLAGRFPATRGDAIRVGHWLRERGFVPTKTGGNQLYTL